MNKSKFLVFSDPHITPTGYDPVVLEDIRRAIIKGRPDYIVCLGDLGDFASQNRLVKDQGSYSLTEEITQAVAYFQHYIVDTVKGIRDHQKKMKKKQYNPPIFVCLGNHDAPATEYIAPLLQKMGVFVMAHKIPVTIDGVTFCHTFDNGISGLPCTTTDQILKQTMGRTVSGHSHVRSITEDRDIHGYKLFAIKCPCATSTKPLWTPQGSLKWDVGFLWLEVDVDSDWFQYTFRETPHG